MIKQYTVFADYHQFYLWDADSEVIAPAIPI
jgi:hypothetical protein